MRVMLMYVILAFATMQAAYAQEEDSADEVTHRLVAPSDLETTRSYQDEDLTLRKFREEDWRDIVSGVDFSEEEQPINKKSDVNLPSFSWGGPLLRIIAYVLAGLAVAAVVYFVVRNIPRNFRYKKASPDAVDPAQPLDDIETLDARALLNRAIKDGDLRLAVRLYYVDLLKQLHGRGLITWKKDKTNHDYLTELLSRNFFFKDIRQLTLSYESVWYGEHHLRPESFDDLSKRFETILQKINSSE